MEIKTIQVEKNEQLIKIFKLVSIIILLTIFILEIEILIFFIIKIFSNNIILAIILFIFFHYLILHFGIECFLFLIQFPIIGKSSLHSNGCFKANNLIVALSTFIDICEKIVENEKISLFQEYSNLLDIYEGINMMIYIYYEVKKKYGLSKYQKKLYDSLIIWRKHFKSYKIMQYFKENKIYMGDYTNMSINKKLVQMILDSNFIIKIAEDYICEGYHFLSFKKIYNYLFNDTFCSMNQYKAAFNLKFKEKSNKFITSDNKIIDFTIVDSKKLIKEITNSIPFQTVIKNKNKEKELNSKEHINKMEKIEEDENSLSTISNLSLISSKKTNKKKKNLIIFSNPNSMIYEFFSPEKYFFYYEGGCDILFWNYRGYGLSEGHCTFKNNKKDILELFDEIKKTNKYEKFGVHGYSIGGISATFLAKNRDIDLLVSDRNFSSVGGIAESYPFGRIAKFLCKFILLDKLDNELNYLFTKNIKCCKIILCDPSDEVVQNNGSVKSSISKYIIKNCIKDNKYENILDLILEKKDNNKFINALLNIMKFLDKNSLFKENIFVQCLNNFFECFMYGSEDLINFRNFSFKRLKILYINNFFNNFFKKKKKNYDDTENGKENSFYNTENNLFYLDKAIDNLNVMIDLEKHIEKLDSNFNILDEITTLKSGIIQIKNKIQKINFFKEVSKGFLIRLNCGHNIIVSGKEENMIVEILEKCNFLK